jgi:hypothetical protein
MLLGGRDEQELPAGQWFRHSRGRGSFQRQSEPKQEKKTIKKSANAYALLTRTLSFFHDRFWNLRTNIFSPLAGTVSAWPAEQRRCGHCYPYMCKCGPNVSMPALFFQNRPFTLSSRA